MALVPYTTQYVLGWRNVFAEGDLSASSALDGYAVENLVDGFTFDYWGPDAADAAPWVQVDCGTATAVDYLAITAHNLASLGASLQLLGSADGASWSAVAGPWVPARSGPLLWQFAAVSFRYYRLSVTGSGVRLGVLQAGARTTLPEGVFVGYSPEALNRRYTVQNQESEAGVMLGRSVTRVGVEGKITQKRVSQAWARGEWRAFTDHAVTRPFFIAWRASDYPDEVAYAWSSGDGPSADQGDNGWMKLSLSFKGQTA